jgi:hypothetical protein
MRKTILTLLLTLVFGSFLQAQTNQKITVQVNQQRTLAKNKLTIKFVSFVEDSRCPTDTKCIQAGNAKIQIKVKKANGASKTFELNTNDKPQVVSFAGYTIKLTDLNPKPATNIRINRLGFKATFMVSKSENSNNNRSHSKLKLTTAEVKRFNYNFSNMCKYSVVPTAV